MYCKFRTENTRVLLKARIVIHQQIFQLIKRWAYTIACPIRQPETVFVPQMFVPENGQSWQSVGCLVFQASRALAPMRT